MHAYVLLTEAYIISSPPSEGVCTPPITMSTITCTTSSTHQSSNNTRSMICSVPSTETLSVNVTVTNAAGRTVMKSSYSGLFRLKITIGITMILFSVDILALACQNTIINSACSITSSLTETTNVVQPSTAEIALSATTGIIFFVLIGMIILLIVVLYFYKKVHKSFLLLLYFLFHYSY